jgi:hypothetical protein
VVGGGDEPRTVDVPRDARDPLAGRGGHEGREWDQVG